MDREKIVKAFSMWAPQEIRGPYSRFLQDPSTKNAIAFVEVCSSYKGYVCAALGAANIPEIVEADKYSLPRAMTEAVRIAVENPARSRAELAAVEMSYALDTLKRTGGSNANRRNRPPRR